LIVIEYKNKKEDKMKTLIVYYSRHNHTRIVGQEIAKKLGAEVEEIQDTKDRMGLFGWFNSAFDEELRTPTKIKSHLKDPSKYDLIVIGTPIWDGIVPCVLEYLKQNKNKFKKVAFFITFGASAENASYLMSEILNKKPLAVLELQDRKIILKKADKEISEFCGKLKK
jgi:flavodoxin